MLGKGLKTWVQMAAIVFLLLAGSNSGGLAIIGYLGLYASDNGYRSMVYGGLSKAGLARDARSSKIESRFS